jgi:hypothetical protein
MDNWQHYEAKKKEIQENSLFEESEPDEYTEEIKRLVEEIGL